MKMSSYPSPIAEGSIGMMSQTSPYCYDFNQPEEDSHSIKSMQTKMHKLNISIDESTKSLKTINTTTEGSSLKDFLENVISGKERINIDFEFNQDFENELLEALS
jgi:hypothetical protein